MNIQDMWMQAQLEKQGGIPSPSDNPALLSAMQQHAPPHHQGNPLNAGATSAMHAVRQALSERPPQKTGLSGVLDSTGKMLQNLGIARLRGSHRAPTALFGQMMQTPDELEHANMKNNMAVLDFLNKQAAVEKDQQYRRDVLAEQRRYHDIIANQRAQKLAAKGTPEISIPGLDLSQFPNMKSTKERGIYATSLNGATEAHELILRSLKNLDKLEKENEGNPIDPTGSMIPGANRISNLLIRGTKKGKKQFELRNMLNSDLSQLEILLERTLKGGVPDAQTIKRLHEEGVYPGLGQPIELNRKKLQDYKKKIEARMKADELSLAANKHIPRDIFEVHEEEPEGEVTESEAASPQESSPINDLVSKVKAVNPGLSPDAILEAARRLSGK